MLTPILVRTFPRSGSTLMMKILSCAADMQFSRVYPYEERDLTYIMRLVNTATSPLEKVLRTEVLGWPMTIRGYPFEPSCDFFNDTDEARRNLFLNLWGGYSQSVRKDGDFNFYAEKIGAGIENQVRSYIGSRTIALFRDPRGVFNSILKFDAKRGYFGFGRAEGDTDIQYAARFCDYQKSHLGDSIWTTDSEDVLRLSYETLMQSFLPCLEKIEAFIGTTLDREMMRTELSAHIEHTTSTNALSSVDEWKTDLAPEVIDLITTTLADDMRALGYI